MKRLLLLLTLALAPLIHAQDYDTFIGIEAGRTSLNFDQLDTQRGGEYGLRLGFIRDTGRVYLSANRADIEESDLQSLSVNFDAITPRAYRFNSYFSVRGFVGLHGGAVQLKSDTLNDDEGVMGGGKAGIFLDFPANISIEVGYKVSWTSLELGSEAVKNCQSAYAAYNYTF